MKTNYFINVITFGSLLLVAACHKDKASPGLADFPVSVGNKWKYIVYDSVHNYTDTQTVAISGATMMTDGRPAKLVRSSFSFSFDSSYAYLLEDADKATFYADQQGRDYNKVYTYPLMVGAWWVGENMLDTNKVVSIGDISVPAGSFTAYAINRDFKVTDIAIKEKEWYCPGVGMVQRNYYERNLGFLVNKTFRLVSYSIIK